ncbi:MAG: hypothetical protein IIX88_00455, partial [Firmicutes bacterium]|nr:hypothetical protein [Bacillota bacterium]
MKRLRLKRMAAVILALLMILGCFVGCGSTEVQGTDQAETTTLSWDITEQSQFRTEKQLEEHYQKHVIDQEEFVDDFGDITIEQYLMLAQWLIDFPDENVIMKYEEDGDELFYNTEYNFFGVLSKDG